MAQQSQNQGIRTFISELSQYQFCPPSDNLWTIEIREHKYGKETFQKSLTSLYTNIISVNKAWNSNTFQTSWGITPPDYLTSNKDIKSSYISAFDNVSGLFLASDFNMATIENTFDTSIGQDLVEHGGFLNMGRVFASRAANYTCNISFLVSNWSITDILFEPWITAISQRGLTEYSDGILPDGKSIRADITIYQYSASMPRNISPHPNGNEMCLRKVITLFNAFPQKRGQVELSYDTGKAGFYTKEIVGFQFDEYSIRYINYEESNNLTEEEQITSIPTVSLRRDKRITMADKQEGINSLEINNFA